MGGVGLGAHPESLAVVRAELERVRGVLDRARDVLLLETDPGAVRPGPRRELRELDRARLLLEGAVELTEALEREAEEGVRAGRVREHLEELLERLHGARVVAAPEEDRRSLLEDLGVPGRDGEGALHVRLPEIVLPLAAEEVGVRPEDEERVGLDLERAVEVLVGALEVASSEPQLAAADEGDGRSRREAQGVV